MKAPAFSFSSLVFALLIVVGALVYANSLGNEMFWDDDDNILRNAYVQDWSRVPRYFSQNLIAGAGLVSNYWRPALLSVWSLEWHLWGGWAPGYHIVNTGVHIAAAYALFLVLFALFKDRRAALFASLVFLLHPLQTEAVTYVSGLGDPLSVLFQLLGLFAYLRFREGKGASWKVAGFFALALMTKETAIIFPGLITLCEGALILRERSSVKLKHMASAAWRASWKLLVMAGGYVLLRATVLNFQNTFNLYNEATPFTQDMGARVVAFLSILPSYLGLIAWPSGLHMERAVSVPSSWTDPSVLGGAAIVLGLALAALWGVRRMPAVSFGIAWFFLGLAPTSNILVPINALMYEHWLYLPLAGIAFALASFALRFSERAGRASVVLGLAALIVLAGLAWGTIQRNRDWRNPVSLYENILRYNQNSLRVWNNLGMAYADRERFEDAEAAYQRAVALDERNQSAPPRHNLGNVLAAQGKEEEAIMWFTNALEIDPRFFFSSNALAGIYLEREEFENAGAVLERALKASPENASVRRNLEIVRLLQERNTQKQ